MHGSRMVWVAGIALAAMVAAGCGAEDGDQDTGAPSAAAQSSGTAQTTEPAAPPSKKAPAPAAPDATLDPDPPVPARTGAASLLTAAQLPAPSPRSAWEVASGRVPSTVRVCDRKVALPAGDAAAANWELRPDPPNADPIDVLAWAGDTVVNVLASSEARGLRRDLVAAVAACRSNAGKQKAGRPAPSAVVLLNERSGVIIENGERYSSGAQQIPRSYVVFSSSASSIHVTTYGTFDGAVSYAKAALALLRAQNG